MANVIRTKLVCVSKTPNEENYVTVHLSPVVGGTTHENDAVFAGATPSGSVFLKLNAEAASTFETGKNYYSDFSPAPI